MSVDGTYDIEVKTPMGKMNGKLIMKTENGAVSGTIQTQIGDNDFSNGTLNGDAFSWSTEMSTPLGKMKLECAGKVHEDSIGGEVKIGSFGTSAFSGKRV